MGALGRVLRYKLRKTPRDVDDALSYTVQCAAENSAGYRRLLEEADVRLERFRGSADLPLLPIVSKESLFRRFSLADVLHRGADPAHCVRTGTSGSTGLPLTVFMNRPEALYRRLLVWRAWKHLARLGIPLKVVDVGTWVEGGRTVRQRRGLFLNVARIPISLPAEEQARLLTKERPHVVSGYPSSLGLIAEALDATNTEVSSARLVASRGEILHEDTRRVLERAFACHVADFYNSEEVGSMAWECPADRSVLHVNTDACVIEVVGEGGEPLPCGTEGRVIVTNLYNATMPFIRYDLHDRGEMLSAGRSRCVCGSQAQRMAVLQGRDDDYVFLPDGRRVSPRLIATAVNRSFAGLYPLGSFDRCFRRFQIIQDARSHVTVRIVPEPDTALDFEGIIGSMLRRIHPELGCSIDIVEDLPLESSGKFKKVIRDI